MGVLIQRVTSAKVTVEGYDKAHIQAGLLLLVGVGREDSLEDIERTCRKIINLRIFEDEKGKMNLNIKQVNAGILSVPQFTLYADTRKGNRPGFEHSAEPRMAQDYWKKCNELLRQEGVTVKEGVFGAHMEIALINDGPVTIWLDSKQK
ncbi:MAG: D-tyrosyl-tRNA(Tyr) deacylase [Thermodesulfovibrionia bacterium]|nr:D-tyrosyl-tRNA(Tyr) deacylase [Thermodesulfovibrionia bacterium]